MTKKLFLPVLSSLLIAACGDLKSSGDDPVDLESLLGDQYEAQDASAEVDEQKFNAFLIDGYNEDSFGLVEAPASAPSGAEGAPKAKVPPSEEEKKKRKEKFDSMKKDHQDLAEKQRKVNPKEKDRPKEKEKPAFRIALQDSRQYVYALVGIDKSPFETFRASLIDAKAKAQSQDEYKSLVDAAKVTFKEEKAAAWKLVAGVAEHKVEIDGIRAARKVVVAACVIEKVKEQPVKGDGAKPEDASKAEPTAEEIAARKLARESERKDEKADHAAKKAKAESDDCVAATASLKTLIGQ